MAVTPDRYLNFRDGTRDAMQLHSSVFGGELTVSTFAESGGTGVDESEQDGVMHSPLVTGDGMTLMAADVPGSTDVSSNGTVSLSGDDEAALRGCWDRLDRRRQRHRPPGGGAVGRHVRHVHRPVRRRLDGQHPRRRVLTGSPGGRDRG